MTDARLPGRWLMDPRHTGLTDRLARVHYGALMWSAEQESDGFVPRSALRLLHPEGATDEDARALVVVGLWQHEATDYRVCEWGRTQSLAADLERSRELSRERQRRHRGKASSTRDRAANVGHTDGSTRVTRDVTRDRLSPVEPSEPVTRDETRMSLGEARQARPRLSETPKGVSRVERTDEREADSATAYGPPLRPSGGWGQAPPSTPAAGGPANGSVQPRFWGTVPEPEEQRSFPTARAVHQPDLAEPDPEEQGPWPR